MKVSLPQILVRSDHTGPVVVAKSEDLKFADENQALTIAARFGLPAEPIDTLIISKLKFNSEFVAIIRGQCPAHGLLNLHFLLIPAAFYKYHGDPFAISDSFPPVWTPGSLSDLSWDAPRLEVPSVERVGELLKSSEQGPFLYGAAQALIDGTRIVAITKAPVEALLRTLWLLLPVRSRAEFDIATYTFSFQPGLHFQAMHEPPVPLPAGHITDEQTRDYPEGRYELAMQTAIESSDQREYLMLLNRRSSQETLKMALMMVLVAFGLALIGKFLL